jgi:hypothetical protein
MSMPSSRRLPATSRRTASNRLMTRPATQTHARTIVTATAVTETVTVATAARIAVTVVVKDDEAAIVTTAAAMTAARDQAEVTMTDTDEALLATDTVEGEETAAATTIVVEDAFVRAPHVVTGPAARENDLVNAVLARSAKEAAVRRPLHLKLLKTTAISVLSLCSRSPNVLRHATSARSSRLLDPSLKRKLLKIE